MTTTIALRDYQEAAITAVLDAQQRGNNRGLIALPPGSGKTVIFVSLIRRLGGRALVLVHRDELLGQALDKLCVLAGDLTTGVVQGPRNELDADVLVASVPTLAQSHRRGQLPRDLSVVIADECHHAAAPTWLAILDHVHAGEPGGPLLIGTTASPDRADGLGLDQLFGDEAIYEASLLDLIDAGYLSPLIARRVTYQADFRQLQVRHGDVTAGSAERAFMGGGGPSAVVKAIQTEAIARQHILVFTPGIASADATANMLAQAGVAAAAVNGETAMAARRETLDRFRHGELRVLVNCQLLTEGVDIPQVDCIVLARPTKSRALYLQMCGRGFRRHPAKVNCLLLDLTANSSRLALVTPASLIGLDPGDVRNGEDLSAAAERKRQQEEIVTQDMAVELHSRPIDILRQRPAAWVPAAGDRFALPLGDGQIILRPDPRPGDLWSVVEVRRGQGTRIIHSGLPIGYAMGVAEAHAKNSGAGALINPHAKWRQRPATDAQVKYLISLGGTLPPGSPSQGEVSALIDAAKAAKARVA